MNTLNMYERNLKLSSEWTAVTSPSAVLGASSCTRTSSLHSSYLSAQALGNHWEQIQPWNFYPSFSSGAPVVEG